ncbi:hypothetical protein BQ8794_60233 [Mesorhizobium prunaredense]|uniref:Uncharacterized protein n=1 Tax=Mesorhizobium prunaredense TaxID=1631249 RepID=A0A1R3VKG5_9HYPH|nr:hypothetical protein BQ8794_60233 [Mesorhizobium prunaredense]
MTFERAWHLATKRKRAQPGRAAFIENLTDVTIKIHYGRLLGINDTLHGIH